MQDIQDILAQAAAKDDEFQKKRSAGLAKVGLNQPESQPMRVPAGPESIDTIPQQIRDMKPGDPENTSLLEQQFKQLAGEINVLSNQRERGILEGLHGPRKWSVAIQLALNPGLRGKINGQLRKVRDQGIAARRELMFRIGQELRIRSVDPIKQAALEATAKQYYGELGKARGQEAARQQFMGYAAKSGVFTTEQLFNLEQYQYDPRTKTLEEGVNGAKSLLDTTKALETMARLGGIADIEGLKAVASEQGQHVPQEAWNRIEAIGRVSVDKPKDENPAAAAARMDRETRMLWNDTFSMFQSRYKTSTSFVSNQKAVDAGLEDPVMVKIPTWTKSPEELLKLTRDHLTKFSSYDPKFWDRFSAGLGADPAAIETADDEATLKDMKAYAESLTD